MIDRISASEIARALGIGRRAVLRRAERERWPYDPSASRGGAARQYPIDSLPDDVRAALSSGTRRERIAPASLDGLSATRHLPDRTQRKLDARLAILAALERASASDPSASLRKLACAYSAGELPVEAWVRETLPVVSVASLIRWRRRLERGGPAALADRYGARRRHTLIDRQPHLAEFARSMLVAFPHTTVRNVLRAMHARFNGHNLLRYPSPRTLERWVVRWKRENEEIYTAVTSPDAWKSRYMSAFGRAAEDATRANALWELDSTPGDVLLTDGRHMVLGVVDVATRRAKLLVSRTSKATAVATLLRHALIEWGVPEAVKTDAGSEYTSHHIRRVLAALAIEHRTCNKFSPWEKPHIERFFRTFAHGLVELLPGYCGHDVAERQEIESRHAFAERILRRGGAIEVKMSAAEFQRFCDRWCEDVYAHEAHDGLGGKTPFEASAARAIVRTVPDERALDVLLAEAPDGRTRVVQKRGLLIDRAWFIAPELAGVIGQEVVPLLDPLDLGRVYVYSLDGAFLCIAECPERTGMDRREVAIRAREAQKASIQAERAALRAAARKIRTDDVVREILEERAEASGKLVRLPPPAQAHDAHGLREAERALRAGDLPTSEPVTEQELAELDAALERAAAAVADAPNVVPLDDPETNYRRWLRLDEAIRDGRIVHPRDRAWHAAYYGSDEWRAMRALCDEFPELRGQTG